MWPQRYNALSEREAKTLLCCGVSQSNLDSSLYDWPWWSRVVGSCYYHRVFIIFPPSLANNASLTNGLSRTKEPSYCERALSVTECFSQTLQHLVSFIMRAFFFLKPFFTKVNLIFMKFGTWINKAAFETLTFLSVQAQVKVSFWICISFWN